jgi:hypothetical protein
LLGDTIYLIKKYLMNLFKKEKMTSKKLRFN